ncbi:isocitrate lyase/PEP mutase family protein [Mesorhizobium sp. 1B3]|uniref:isocitrate lyase/PEP mutase family protein n=1 Tax=Mesorhizobium sp. 1B3 TaxID=3243599 RepID=UPI003D965AF9
MGKKFRDVLARQDILVLPGVHDGYSTRLVKRAGFAAATIGGSGISEARLGWADRGLMGMRENVDAARDLCACEPDLPMLADGDTGYGNAINAHFTVKAFERIGAAGVLIEDQTWPKRCGHMKGKSVIDREEAVDKIRAAVEAKSDPHFVLMGRTDTAATHGVAEAITRLNLFAEAGADLLFADALLSEDDIATVARETVKPLVVNMGLGLRARSTTPLISPARLRDLGVRVVVYPRLLTAAAVNGMNQAMDIFVRDVLNGEGHVDRPDLLASFEGLNALTGVAHLDALETNYAVAAPVAAPGAQGTLQHAVPERI